jgi:hypothetical protein
MQCPATQLQRRQALLKDQGRRSASLPDLLLELRNGALVGGLPVVHSDCCCCVPVHPVLAGLVQLLDKLGLLLLQRRMARLKLGQSLSRQCALGLELDDFLAEHLGNRFILLVSPTTHALTNTFHIRIVAAAAACTRSDKRLYYSAMPTRDCSAQGSLATLVLVMQPHTRGDERLYDGDVPIGSSIVQGRIARIVSLLCCCPSRQQCDHDGSEAMPVSKQTRDTRSRW